MRHGRTDDALGNSCFELTTRTNAGPVVLATKRARDWRQGRSESSLLTSQDRDYTAGIQREIPCRGQTQGAQAAASPPEEPTDEADFIHLGMKHFEEHHDFGPDPDRPEQAIARGRAFSGPRGSPVIAQDYTAGVRRELTCRGQTRGARADSAARTAACSQLQVLPAEDGCLRGFISAEPWRMKRLQSAACPSDREEHNGRQPRPPPHARSGRQRCWTNMYQEMLGSAQHIK